jgi:hypothetical protein
MQYARVRELCSQITAEANSEKLIDLIHELRVLLAEKNGELGPMPGRKQSPKLEATIKGR